MSIRPTERILWVNDKTDGGGAGKLFRAAARVLRAAGHEIAPFFGSFSSGEVPSEFLPFQPQSIESHQHVRFLKRQLGDAAVTDRLRQLIAYFRPTVVVVQNCHKFIGPHVIEDAQAQGIPVVLMINDYGSYCVNCYAWRAGAECHKCADKFFIRGVLRDCSLRKDTVGRGLAAVRAWVLSQGWKRNLFTNADAYFAAGMKFGNQLVAAGFSQRKLVLGIYPHDVEIALSSGAIASTVPKFVFYGSELPIKGQSLIVDAIKDITAECEIVFLVLKPSEHLRIRLAEAVSANPLVRFRIDSESRWMSGVQDEIRNACAVLVPSTWCSPHELVAYESMALGRALIVSDCCSNAELIQSSRNGLVFSSSQPAELARAMNTLIQSPTIAQELGVEAKRYYDEQLRAERWVPKFLECVDIAKRKIR